MQGLTAENGSTELAEVGLPNDAILLLDEVEVLIDAATDIVLQPCDCRRLGQHCERPEGPVSCWTGLRGT